MSQELESILETHDEREISAIAEEYGKLFDWFNKEYPEGRIRLDINNDKTFNNGAGALKYKLSVMTGKEATPDNQGYFESTVVITRERFTNPNWMSMFKQGIVRNYTRAIAKVYNDHYNQEKEKSKLVKN